MPGSFGAKLRQQREERQIDLIAIAAQTKIKLGLLEGLERDDVSHWPSGIFRRAYIRSYAQIIGLDPDVVLREFLEVHPDPGDAFASLAAGPETPEDASSASGAPPMRLWTIVDSAIGSLAKLRRPPASHGVSSTRTPLNVSVPAVSSPTPEPAVSSAPGDTTGQASPGSGRPSSVPEPAPAVVTVAPERSSDPGMAEHADDTAGNPVDPPGWSAPDLGVEEGGRADADEQRAANDAVLEAVAHLCTELGRAVDRDELQRLLQDSAGVLNAAGLIVWLCDERAEELTPALVHGYPHNVVAHLPTVTRDADNATAAAFRTGKTCELAATACANGAMVVPLLMPEGCAGVLAIELRQGVQPTRSGRSIAILLAAALAQLVHRSQTADEGSPVDRGAAGVPESSPPLRPAGARR